MYEVGPRTKRMLLLTAMGILCLGGWLYTLQIKGSVVFYYLERFAVHDDGRYLLAAACTLVCLNTLRAIFLYTGWFNLGESISYSARKWSMLSWLVPLIAIPASYLLMSTLQDGLALHFGLPALFSIGTVIVMRRTTQDIRGWLPRSMVIVLLVFAFQWLDLAPSLSHWGFGGGELSVAVKQFAALEEWDWVLDGLAVGLFLTSCAGGFAAAALLVGANNRAVQFKKIRARDREIAALREEAIRVRGYREIQQLVHDLKRPLTTILGLADVMAETLPASPSLQYARKLSAAGTTMNQMIEELLKENARQEIRIASLLEYVQSQVSAFSWRHIVTVSVDEAVLERTILVNRIRFSRALVNLLDNAHLAVKDTPGQHIVLSAHAQESTMLFRVSDNGKGFPEQFTVADWGISEWGSTGIGLAFVEEVVKKHGGEMTIANKPDGGAEVTLSLPVAKIGSSTSCSRRG